MIIFNIKEGWQLTNNSKKINNIIKAIERNEGNCPCQPTHPKCPCDKYLKEDNCCCGLYIKN